MEKDKSVTEQEESYLRFKEKYGITLNEQQEQALQAIEGANLLLAVPGSGKTTVLVARLGYMIIEKHIDPESILAVTYNKSAAVEMEARFTKKFGTEHKMTFRTLNSLALHIYVSFCQAVKKPIRKLIEGAELRALAQSIYVQVAGEYPTESELIEFQTAVVYIKNMGLDREGINELSRQHKNVPNLNKMYDIYQDQLAQRQLMDFDDQIVFAHAILKTYPQVRQLYKNQYRYICVDEAQDTSKLQHEIIEMLAHRNNLFMVGDEDQSIYGFRAAYPQALLDFTQTYPGAYVLQMECNYRSTPQIVERAQAFVSKNKNRFDKNMVANRGAGEDVSVISVRNRSEQYRRVLSIAKERTGEIAFLYRENESSVVIVDSFLRENVPFKMKKPELSFFSYKVVRDIVAYLTLALDPHDADAFMQIRNKGILFLKEAPAKWVVQKCKEEGMDVLTALDALASRESELQPRIRNFRRFLEGVRRYNSMFSIDYICDCGYDRYIEEKTLDFGKTDTLRLLAEREPDKRKFLQRLKFLEEQYEKGFAAKGENPVILSTIHSSKGLEYDTVYMVDVYDGKLPSRYPNGQENSRKNSDEAQEDRRLFYVGITRAKNRLFLLKLEDKDCSYISELCPKPIVQPIREPAKPKKTKKVKVVPPTTSLGMIVVHQTFGEGAIIARREAPCFKKEKEGVVVQDKVKTHITVSFRDGEKSFLYPDAFQSGFLIEKNKSV